MRREYEFVIYAIATMLLSGVFFVIQRWFPYVPNVFIKVTLWIGFGFLVVEGILQFLARVRKFRSEVKT